MLVCAVSPFRFSDVVCVCCSVDCLIVVGPQYVGVRLFLVFVPMFVSCLLLPCLFVVAVLCLFA